mgnify:FL=1|jgi:hypothetical protein
MKYLKLIVAVAMIACLLPMPYGFYTLVRFFAMVIFAVFAYQYYQKHCKPLSITFGALALLFQPFVKIVLGRGVWNIVDIVVAILLVVLWYKENKKNETN